MQPHNLRNLVSPQHDTSIWIDGAGVGDGLFHPVKQVSEPCGRDLFHSLPKRCSERVHLRPFGGKDLLRRWRGWPRLKLQIIAKQCRLSDGPIPKASRGNSIIWDNMVRAKAKIGDKGSVGSFEQ
jgi:hypothetical protein